MNSVLSPLYLQAWLNQAQHKFSLWFTLLSFGLALLGILFFPLLSLYVDQISWVLSIAIGCFALALVVVYTKVHAIETMKGRSGVLSRSFPWTLSTSHYTSLTEGQTYPNGEPVVTVCPHPSCQNEAFGIVKSLRQDRYFPMECFLCFFGRGPTSDPVPNANFPHQDEPARFAVHLNPDACKCSLWTATKIAFGSWPWPSGTTTCIMDNLDFGQLSLPSGDPVHPSSQQNPVNENEV